MPVNIDIARLISDHWVSFSTEEQKTIEQRIRDLVLLSLTRELEAAVLPQEAPVAPVGIIPTLPAAAPSPDALSAVQRVSAADVPFGNAENYQDYSYDDFARLAEDHGVPPTAAIGHWFGKSLGIEFDKSTPEIRRKVYAEMVAFYETQPIARLNAKIEQMMPVGRPPMAVVQAPYVQPRLGDCPSCGKTAKFVAGGVSKKTGKPYNGFYACTGGCKTWYQGNEKDLTWTVDRDWISAYNKAHGVSA